MISTAEIQCKSKWEYNHRSCNRNLSNRPVKFVRYIFPVRTTGCFSKEFSFCFFISCARIYPWTTRLLKETIITWSEMGKQNIQAKEVYCKLRAPAPRQKKIEPMASAEAIDRPKIPQQRCHKFVSTSRTYRGGYWRKKLPWTILEEQFPAPRNVSASKIGNGLISLL